MDQRAPALAAWMDAPDVALTDEFVA